MTIDPLLVQRLLYLIIAAVMVWGGWRIYALTGNWGEVMMFALLFGIIVIGPAWLAADHLHAGSPWTETLSVIAWAGFWIWAALYLIKKLPEKGG